MSASRLLGTLVVRIASEMSRYKADMGDAANATSAAAQRIEQSSGRASAAAGMMNGSMGGAVQGAQALHAAAGLAGVGVGFLAVGLAAAGYAAFKGSQEDQAYQKSLILTGNVAGTTAGQMADMAKNIGQSVGTQYEAAAALAAMAGSGQVAAGSLQKFSQTAIEMERTVGQSVGDTAKVFAELGQEPVKASLKLNEAMNYLTASTFAQIKAADDLGDREAAASIAQDAYASAMDERTARIKGNLGTLETAWNGVAGAAKWAWDKMLNLGREATLAEKLAAVGSEIEKGRKAFDVSAFGGNAEARAQLQTNLQIQANLQEMVRLEKHGAEAAGARAASEKSRIGWMQDGDKYLSKQEKMEQAITRLRFEGNAAGATELEIEKRIAVVREKGRDKGQGRAGPKDNSAAREQAERMRLGRAAAIAAGDEVTRENEAFAKSLEIIAKADLNAAEAHSKYVESLVGGLGKLKAETLQQQEYNDRLGLGKEAIAVLDSAKLESQAITLELMAIKALDKNLDQSQYNLYKAQAEELRTLAQLKKIGAQRSAGLDAQAEQDKASNDFSQGLHSDLKGALSAAFRDSKNPIKAFGDALGNTVFTRVAGSIADAMATKFMGSAVGTGLMSMFGFEQGGAFDQRGVHAFADGGAFHNSVLNQTTPFAFANGAGFNQAVAGEAGPEAVMPLERGPDGRLGVKALGSTAPNQTINININAVVGDVASKSDVVAGMRATAAQIKAELSRSRTHGGAWA